MLGGVDPVLILQLSALGPSPLAGLAGVPVLGDVLPVTGVPIPIYLSESLTGIYVESESTQVSVSTDVKITNDGDEQTNQQAIASSLTVNLIARRSSPLLSVILAFMDVCVSRLVQKTYAITYVNGPITVFNGLIQDFSQQADRNSNLVRITLALHRAKKREAGPGIKNIAKVTGAVPV